MISLPYAGQGYLTWVTDRDPNHSFTKDELIGVLADTQLYYSYPGNEYHYSDQHFTILGKIVEIVSGISLNAFVSLNFLIPSGLDVTYFVTDGSQWNLPAPYITGYSIRGGTTAETETTNYNYSYDPGSGNLITNTANLVGWIRQLIRGETALTKNTITQMCTITPPSTAYGLGLGRRSTASNFILGWGHTGGTAGYLTDAYHDPSTDITYVLQCSLIDFNQMNAMADWLADIALKARRLVGY